MSLAVANIENGGYISARGLGFGAGIGGAGIVSGFRVRAESTPSMRVRVGGEYSSSLLDERGRLIDLSDRAVLQHGLIPYMLFTDDNQAVTTNTVTSHASLVTRCAVVLYVDDSVSGGATVIDGSNGAARVALVAGTPDSSEPMPTPSQIQSATGTPHYEIIASIRLTPSATTITNSMITDLRRPSTDVGVVKSFCGDSSVRPNRTLICDGSQVEIAKYSLLYRVVGNTFAFDSNNSPKSADSGKFFLPDLRGRVLTGFDASQTEFNTLGKRGGNKTCTLTVDEMPRHNHPVTEGGRNSYNTSKPEYGHVGSWTIG